jgi:hypothetical protein
VARVELWESILAGEAGDAVLLVICDASIAVGEITTAAEFSDVVAALKARAIRLMRG